jgi:excisionase family DNA binding protein
MTSPVGYKHAYSVNEACKAMGLGRTKLYDLINAGKIVARKDGGRTVILPDDIESYLRALPVIKPRDG